MHLESMGMTELTIHYQVGGGSPFSPPPASSSPSPPLTQTLVMLLFTMKCSFTRKNLTCNGRKTTYISCPSPHQSLTKMKSFNFF